MRQRLIRQDLEQFSAAQWRLANTEGNVVDEIIFHVQQAEEGGYVARALGESIFTEADTLDVLKAEVQDLVRCHFDEGHAPRIIRLHIVREEVFAA